MANNWKKQKQVFRYYTEGKGLDNTRKKISQLLHYAGMGVQEVKAKIYELLEGDIIELVEGPTTWASQVVVAPKPSGEIRVCVNVRHLNEAIIRERLPMSPVNEVLEELNGSTLCQS